MNSNRNSSRGMGEERRRGGAGIWRRRWSGVWRKGEEERGVLDHRRRWGRLVASDNDLFFAWLPAYE